MRMHLFAAVSIFAWALGGATSAEAAKASIGKISYVQGSAFRGESDDGPFSPLRENSDIFEGDFLKTDAEARLEARLADRSIIRLGQNAKLKVEQARIPKSAEQPKSFSAKLMLGRLWAKVTALVGTESRFEVSTQNAVAGVRGTTFAVDRGSDQSTTVKVYSGKVLISNKPVYMKTEAPGKKTGRVQVAGPQEVSKKQWEEMIAAALQQVRIAAAGDMSPMESFAEKEDAKDEWVAWNKERDGK